MARSASCIDAWLSCGRTARGAAKPPGPMLLPARPLGPGAAIPGVLCPPSVCSSCACAAEAADAEAGPKLATAPLTAGWPASCSRFKYPDLSQRREHAAQARWVAVCRRREPAASGPQDTAIMMHPSSNVPTQCNTCMLSVLQLFGESPLPDGSQLSNSRSTLVASLLLIRCLTALCWHSSQLDRHNLHEAVTSAAPLQRPSCCALVGRESCQKVTKSPVLPQGAADTQSVAIEQSRTSVTYTDVQHHA